METMFERDDIEPLIAIYQDVNVLLSAGKDFLFVRIGALLIENMTLGKGEKECYCSMLRNSLWLVIRKAPKGLYLVWMFCNPCNLEVDMDIIASLARDYTLDTVKIMRDTLLSLDTNLLDCLRGQRYCTAHSKGLCLNSLDLLDNSALEEILNSLQVSDLYNVTETVLTSLQGNHVYFLEDQVETNQPDIREDVGKQDLSYETVIPINDTGDSRLVTSAESIIDRKSVFIGHAANVNSRQEALQLIETVKRRYTKATHNMYAFRVGGGSCSVTPLDEDNDDDGEKAAGSRLLFLLQKMQKYNILVLVTRFYGGVHLGPVRFKRIQDAAISAITLLGKKDDKP